MIKRFMIVGIFILVLAVAFNSHSVSAQETTVCCSQTTTGASCQNVPANECAEGAEQVPTACESTSFCKPGTCYDSNEGTCLDNTPQLVCNNNGGVWSEDSPPQCATGCCILGDQAAFVSLVRCKKLSSELGLETNYDSSIQSEAQCIIAVQTQDKGACVFEFEFEKTCKFVTRAECEGSTDVGGNGTISESTFYVNKLCSAEELGTVCGPSTQTTCVPGKDGVHFVDTCGNPANIYDSSKVDDKEYWTNVKDVSESCSAGSSNAGSSSCGNCNYLLGSICRSDSVAGGNPTYGDSICADLNCRSTSNGQSYLHGESWCVYNDQGSTGEGENSVGSRFFKHICINGEEVVESCEDFRAEECIQDEINGFSQAACRVNRWQDCVAQADQTDCENTDRRDCIWREDLSINATGDKGTCLPMNPPGLKFWEGEEAQTICSQASVSCIVQFEKGIFGGEECVDNCECLSDEWEKERNELCRALGDCGPAVNWVGQEGFKDGFKIEIGKTESLEDEGDDGGLF